MVDRWYGTVRWSRRFARESRAAASIEYGVLLALITVTVVGAVLMLGTSVRDGTRSISAGLADSGPSMLVQSSHNDLR